jgi:hypothetical protein
MEKSFLIEQLRKKRLRLLRAYVLHVGWFTSMCASAATDATHVTIASSLWLTLITVVPVLIYTLTVHRAIRAVEPSAPSAGPVQIIITLVLFTPFEAGLILPAKNLWVSRCILRAWDKTLICRSNPCGDRSM